MFNISIRASYVAKVIVGVVVGATLSFTAAFMLLLDRVFGALNSASSFFGSANVLMYLSIEGMFLIAVIGGAAYIVMRS